MSRYTTSAQSALGREVAEKRRLMYERHGGQGGRLFCPGGQWGPVGGGAWHPGNPDGTQEEGL